MRGMCASEGRVSRVVPEHTNHTRGDLRHIPGAAVPTAGGRAPAVPLLRCQPAAALNMVTTEFLQSSA
ncbi:hypothetical protein GCM10009668_31320 [Nocardioides dubius]|uniref:Uncharacterized protein n=1 Tax=Nocardioides dubius TaxID=317019 RepID=A0ABN1TYS0_9ACTN